MSYARIKRENKHNLMRCLSEISKSDIGSEIGSSNSVWEDDFAESSSRNIIRTEIRQKSHKPRRSPTKRKQKVKSPQKKTRQRERVVESIIMNMSPAEIEENFRRHLEMKRRQDEFQSSISRKVAWRNFKLWYQRTLVRLIHKRGVGRRFTLQSAPIFTRKSISITVEPRHGLDDEVSTDLDFSLSDIPSPAKSNEEDLSTTDSIIKDSTQDLESSDATPLSPAPSPPAKPDITNALIQSLREKLRPAPIDVAAPVQSPPKTGLRMHALRRREPELKTYLRRVVPEPLFQELQRLQQKGQPLPAFTVPPNVTPPWQYTAESCEVITDVATEIAESTNLSEHTYESFIDFTHAYFEDARHNKKTAGNFLQDLQHAFTRMSASGRTNICDKVVESIMETSLDLVFKM